MVAPAATPPPSTHPSADAAKVTASAEDAAAAVLACTLLVLSLASFAFILHFHLRASRRAGPHPRPRLLRLRDLNSLWAVRILLVAFACLWSLAELLRLPCLRRSLLGRNSLPEYPPSSRLQLDPCSFYVLLSQGFAEPCFFATLLFLLHASVQGKASYPNAFAAALALSLLASLPFLLSYALFLAFAPWVLSLLGISPEVFFGRDTIGFESGDRCSYPLFSTALLGGFGAVYVPWFVSTCWRAVAVVINKRLRIRLYALTSAVVVGITLQVATLALSTFWSPGDPAFEGLALAAFLGVFFSAAVGEGVLVVYPIADAIDAVSWRPPVAAATTAGDRGDGDGRTAHVSA
ncbi:hypothetical protein Taro_050288 [Colocasia esculenta]|uniref:Uncharacterized protein n=1 Tax=Colocasia esculenta TaxID=4460 RepID=A0A843XDJ2_COLES|nr:hypothetical protein [Colocasia esculenta]